MKEKFSRTSYKKTCKRMARKETEEKDRHQDWVVGEFIIII